MLFQPELPLPHAPIVARREQALGGDSRTLAQARFVTFEVMDRRGVVYIAPTADYMPTGRLVDPDRSSFHVHWEDPEVPEMLANAGEIDGAEEAIRWGRERCDRVLIRLAHTLASYYSAGDVPVTENLDGTGRRFPIWPPTQQPPEGWWTPEDEEAAWKQAVEDARRMEPRLPDDDPPPGPGRAATELPLRGHSRTLAQVRVLDPQMASDQLGWQDQM